MSLYSSESYTTQSLALLDEEFLATLSEQKSRSIYARIISLDINENPIDQIEGRVTGGSINIDGASSVRRSCSLTMISDKVDINDFYWGIKTKFKLEIGLRNQLTGDFAPGKNSFYPEIVWFPQGYFIVSAFNTSISTNSCTVSLSGKDKMCLLNGEFGGQLFASIDFGAEETVTNIMEPISTKTLNSSSEDILANKYYIQPTDITDEEYAIIDKNPYYFFVLNQKNGKYYKKGNIYYYYQGNNKPKQYNYYDMYKIVKHPIEIYNEVDLNTFNYIPDTYYYLKDNDSVDAYFVLDTDKKKTNGRIYYSLNQLYQKYSDLTIKKINLEKIIRESVHAYAKEPYYNIIINDLDDYGLEQLTYKGDDTLYALYNTAASQFTNLILAGKNKSLDTIIENNGGEDFRFYSINSTIDNDESACIRLENGNTFSFLEGQHIGSDIFKVTKFEYGDDVGYRLTDLTYTGDLISAIGDSLTTVLDKIKQMLGDFEYFYDVEGRFIFQRKQTCVQTSWSQLTNNGDESYVDFSNNKRKFSFNFEGNRLISAIQNSPVLTNLKNDYVVWGKRKGISGQDIPIHARYAIDKKPVYYKALNGKIYTSNINYAFEQENLSKEDYEYANILPEEIKNFTLTEKYPVQGLEKPIKKSDGTWTPGWWNIKDWARYYKLLKRTDEDPRGTMKFYSSGDENGCVNVSTVANLPGINLPANSENSSVWLIEIINYANGRTVVNLNHGCGVYGTHQRECSYKESYEKENGSLDHVDTGIRKIFPAPYSICNDSHTYLFFNKQNYSDVYFYNPQFPTGETAQELISEQMEINKKQWLIDHNIYIVDWREIIYQMALDYFAGQGCSSDKPLYIKTLTEEDEWEEMTNPDHFLYEVGRRNSYYYPTGHTGYEQYYTDMQGFWRQLYNPDYVPIPTYSKGYYKNTLKTNAQGYYVRKKVWVQPLIEDYTIEYYVNKDKEEIAAQIQELKDLQDMTNISPEYQNKIIKILKHYEAFVEESHEEDASGRLYWNRDVFEHPETLNFWIDFLDSDLELAQFSVQQVGDRIKVVNDDKANAIVYTDIPNFILYEHKQTKTVERKDENGNTAEYTVEVCDESQLRREIVDKSGYQFIYLPKGFAQFFTISCRNASVKSKIDDLLYQYGYCIENISLTTIPIYYLQPNTRIYVQDKTTNIDGEYLVSKLTIPLTYNGTMSITATKAPERLY